jgi:hypothetical protein
VLVSYTSLTTTAPQGHTQSDDPRSPEHRVEKTDQSQYNVDNVDMSRPRKSSGSEDCGLATDLPQQRRTRSKSTGTHYTFANPLSEVARHLDIAGLAKTDRDWRTMTGLRPPCQTEEKIIDRLIEMERLQVP